MVLKLLSLKTCLFYAIGFVSEKFGFGLGIGLIQILGQIKN